MSDAPAAPPRVFQITGDFDTDTSPRLRNDLLEAIAWQDEDGPSHLVVDLNAAGVVDSVGWAVLISTDKRLGTRGGRLLLVGTDDRVCRMHRVMRLGVEGSLPGGRSLPLYASVAEALASLHA